MPRVLLAALAWLFTVLAAASAVEAQSRGATWYIDQERDQNRLTFGGAAAAASHLFTYPLAGRFVGSDRVAIVDWDDRAIRIYSSEDASFVTTLGRMGEGPREFKAAPLVRAASDEGLWAWDAGNLRLTRWTLDGAVLESHTLTPGQTTGVPASGIPAAWDVSAEGRILYRDGRTARTGNRVVRTPMTVVIDVAEPTPKKVGGMAPTEYMSSGAFYLESPFAPARLAAFWGETVAEPQRGSWAIRQYGLEGELVRTYSLPVFRTPVDRSLIARERRSLEERHPQDPIFAQLLDQAEMPDSTEAIHDVRASTDGRLWVRRWGPSDESIQTYDVLDAQGEWEATVRVQGQILDSSQDRVLYFSLDEFDVPVFVIAPLPPR